MSYFDTKNALSGVLYEIMVRLFLERSVADQCTQPEEEHGHGDDDQPEFGRPLDRKSVV